MPSLSDEQVEMMHCRLQIAGFSPAGIDAHVQQLLTTLHWEASVHSGRTAGPPPAPPAPPWLAPPLVLVLPPALLDALARVVALAWVPAAALGAVLLPEPLQPELEAHAETPIHDATPKNRIPKNRIEVMAPLWTHFAELTMGRSNCSEHSSQSLCYRCMMTKCCAEYTVCLNDLAKCVSALSHDYQNCAQANKPFGQCASEFQAKGGPKASALVSCLMAQCGGLPNSPCQQ